MIGKIEAELLEHGNRTAVFARVDVDLAAAGIDQRQVGIAIGDHIVLEQPIQFSTYRDAGHSFRPGRCPECVSLRASRAEQRTPGVQRDKLIVGEQRVARFARLLQRRDIQKRLALLAGALDIIEGGVADDQAFAGDSPIIQRDGRATVAIVA